MKDNSTDSTSKIGRAFDRILQIGAILSAVLMIFIMLIISFDVISRYTINKPLEWAVEISQYSLVAITFFATAWVLKRESHVKMDQLFNYLGPRSQKVLNVVTSVLSGLACVTIIWYGILVLREQILTDDRYYTTMETPKWPITTIVILGFVLLLFQFIRRTCGYFRDSKTSPD